MEEDRKPADLKLIIEIGSGILVSTLFCLATL